MIAASNGKKRKRLTQPQLAKELGRSTRIIQDYQARGMPRDATPSEARAWIAMNVGVRHLRDEELSATAKQLELEKLAEEVRGRRLKNDIASGRLIYMDDVRLSVAEAFTRVKARLDDIPDVVAREVAPAERRNMRRIVEHAIEIACRELAGGGA